MENEIKKFDVNEAMNNVKDKIKDAFVSLIPDEQWNEMVKKEVDNYFLMKDDGYGERGRSSSFTKDVHTCLQDEVKTRLKQYFNENFNNIWFDNGIPICNAKVEEMITKNSGKILTNLIGGSIQLAIRNAGFNI